MLSIIMVLIHTNLGITPLPLVVLVSAIMFVGISSRMIPSQALISAIPSPDSRGSYMSVSASVQQISGGIAAALAGLIVTTAPDETLIGYNWLGFVVVGATTVTLVMMARIAKLVPETPARGGGGLGH